MDLNLTELQKKAFIKIILEIGLADGKVTTEEINYFRKLINIFSLSDEEVGEAQKMNVLDCIDILESLGEHEKAYLTFTMSRMINVDGNIDNKEMALFRVVCAGAKLPLPKSRAN